MGVCRFYQQGNCKFGDQCKFDHPGSLNGSYDARDSINNRGRNYQGGRYNDSHNYSNNNRGRQEYQTGYQGQNRFQALSDQGREPQKPPGQLQSFPNMATSDIMDQLTKGFEEWEKSCMWLFTCVSIGNDSDCLPGFEDLSPEEIRFKAYEAQKSDNIQSYRQWIEQLSNEIKLRRAKIQQPDPQSRSQLIDVIETMKRNFKKPQQSQSGTNSVFGGATNTQSPGLFGQPATAVSPTAPTGLFGQPATSVSPTTQTGLFGKPVAQTSSVFGNTSNPVQPVDSGASVFGGSSTGSVFGGAQPTNPGGLFGKPATQAAPATGLFGKPAVGQAQSVGVFGSTNQNNATSPFGQISTTTNSPLNKSAQNQANPFAQSPAAISGQGDPNGALFTNSPSTPNTFGNAPLGLFGKPPVAQSTSSFGDAQSSSFAVQPNVQPAAVPVQSANTGDASKCSSEDKLASTYTPINKLTADERSQFEAPKFILGKIPVCPPPKELCT